MYLTTGSHYYICSLAGRVIKTVTKIKIKDPNLKIRLLNFSELHKLQGLMENNVDLSTIYEEIFNVCFINVIGFEEEQIDLDNSGAYIIDSIGSIIYRESLNIIKNLPQAFTQVVNTIPTVDVIAAKIAYHLNMNYEIVSQLPMDELIRLYAIAHIATGGVVPPLEYNQDKIEGKVGV